MNLLEFQMKFKDEQACRDWLANSRWGAGKTVCPHCKSQKEAYKYQDGRLFKCIDCKKQFTVRIGTIFGDSRIPLVKWFIAIYLFTSLKKGISSCQLAKYIGITQKSAWFMLHRIRTVMEGGEDDMLGGVVEVDEAYFGGKAENKHMKDRIKAKGVYEKTIAVGMVSRTDGKVKIKKVENTTSQTLQTQIHNNIKDNSVVITDEHKGYHSLSNTYNHHSVNHSHGQYVNGEIVFEKRGFGRVAVKIHTNSIESVWSHLKRGINGIYHWASKKHFQKYFDEYAYRFNVRYVSDFDKFAEWFGGCEGGKLVYSDLIK